MDMSQILDQVLDETEASWARPKQEAARQNELRGYRIYYKGYPELGTKQGYSSRGQEKKMWELAESVTFNFVSFLSHRLYCFFSAFTAACSWSGDLIHDVGQYLLSSSCE